MQAIVLNADFTYLNTVSWEKAIKLIIKKKAVSVKESDVTLHNYERTFSIKVPMVLRLLEMVTCVFRNKVPYSKKGVLIRDGYMCMYCGSPDGLTVDHVFPTSRGGETSFLNCVACCVKCNIKKDNRTPEEARMRLRKTPYEPSVRDFLVRKIKHEGLKEFINEIF